jgi:signal peptidase II
LLKTKLKSNLLLIGIALVIIVLDQLTKFIIRQNLSLGQAWLPFPPSDFFRIVYWQNTGAAFGTFQNGNTVLKVFTSVIILVILFYYQTIPPAHKFIRLCLAIMLGGAVGNLIDRFRLGYVLDFIAVGRFPVFNVADSCVTVGVGLLILAMYLEEKKTHPSGMPGADSDQSQAQE